MSEREEILRLEGIIATQDAAIKRLLDANKELDREKLTSALKGLAILVNYSLEEAGLVRA
jgi:hypothetical protein